jgi:hypothetical protein
VAAQVQPLAQASAVQPVAQSVQIVAIVPKPPLVADWALLAAT